MGLSHTFPNECNLRGCTHRNSNALKHWKQRHTSCQKVYVEVEELHPNNIPRVARLDNGRSAGKGCPSDYMNSIRRTVAINGVDHNP